MSLRLQSYKAQNSMIGAALTSMGIAGEVGPAWGAVSASVVAGVDICIEMFEKSIKGGVPATPAQAWIRVTKVLGPYIGVSPSHFVILVGATSILAASGLAFVLATGPVDIALGGACLFFDALAYAAADRDVRVDDHSAAMRIGALRSLRKQLEAENTKRQNSRQRHAT